MTPMTKMTPAVAALGRVLLAAIFIQGGFGKLLSPEQTMGYIGASGLPMPGIAYAVSVAVELGGGLAILFGIQARLVSAALAVFCVVTAVQFHFHPGQQMQMINFMKNISMAGGFLQITAFGAGAWSLDALLASRHHARPALA